MWAKKLNEVANSPRTLYYRGLSFTRYSGKLSETQSRSQRVFYAYYGSIPMTEAQIEREVDNLVNQKLVPA